MENGKNGNSEKATESPKASKAELQKLFAAYDTAEKGVLAAKKALEKAQAVQSAAVAAICTKAGARGPFQREDGRILTGVERKSKSGGESTWFFKGPSSDGVIEV